MEKSIWVLLYSRRPKQILGLKDVIVSAEIIRHALKAEFL